MKDSLHLSTQRQEIPPAPRKHSHWIVFLVVCFLLGLLVLANEGKIRDLTSQLSRYTALLKQKRGTQVDVEKSEIALAEAREALAKATLLLRQAEIELEHVEIRSTIDGIVLERLVNPD